MASAPEPPRVDVPLIAVLVASLLALFVSSIVSPDGPSESPAAGVSAVSP